MAAKPCTSWFGRSLGAAALVAAVVAVGFVAPAGAAQQPAEAPVQAGSTYLALGDSVPFGFREPTNLPTPTYSDAASFVGYPEDVAADLSLHVRNAACPGETTSSLINFRLQSNGCESSPNGGPGYRTAYPLHVSYQGSQLNYAVRYLRHHPKVRLVSLMIGANDGFLCQETTSDNCVSELQGVLDKVTKNVTTILSRVRTGAGYTGQIVIVNYYSLDYSNPTDNIQSLAINGTVDMAAAPFGVRVADGYGAFQTAAAQAGGDSCAAGLLTTLSTGGCGVHPSVAGQAVLAGAVERVVTKA